MKQKLRLEWKAFHSWRSVLSKSIRRHTNFEGETFETLHSLEIDLFFLIDLYVLYLLYILNVLSWKKMARDEDIALAEIVRKYPAVYDKAVPEYHRKDVQKNCWNVIATELGLELG